jgi:hypothetical protein
VNPALTRLGHEHWLVPLARLWQKSPFTRRSNKKTPAATKKTTAATMVRTGARVDPVEKPHLRRMVGAQTDVRRITLACILQHSQSFCLGGH